MESKCAVVCLVASDQDMALERGVMELVGGFLPDCALIAANGWRLTLAPKQGLASGWQGVG